MPTKAIVVGQNKIPDKLKPIQFDFVLADHHLNTAKLFPNDYQFVELISKDYSLLNGFVYDIIFAYDDENTRKGTLYFGKWNDGIVQDGVVLE